MPAPKPNHNEQTQLLLGALLFPALAAMLILMTFIEPKGLPWLAEILSKQPSWLLWLTRVILAGLLAGVCQFVSRPMLRQFWKNSRDLPASDPNESPERQTVTALWVYTITPAVFGGIFVSVPFTGEDLWGKFLAVLVSGGFFTLAALILGVPRLEELRRRGAWVPPGTQRRPVLVTLALALLIMVAVVAFMHAGVWLLEHSGLAS
jgi:hypothetical protein